jgi:hypothetical protein
MNNAHRARITCFLYLDVLRYFLFEFLHVWNFSSVHAARIRVALVITFHNKCF